MAKEIIDWEGEGRRRKGRPKDKWIDGVNGLRQEYIRVYILVNIWDKFGWKRLKKKKKYTKISEDKNNL